MNVIENWERKAMRAMRKDHYGKAMAYCDCICHFTYDEDLFDCYDRLRQLAEKEDV